MDLSIQVDTVERISVREFRENYLYPQKPVVIKGLAKDTYAGKHWSIPYFKQTMGGVYVDVFDNGNKKAAASAYTRPDLKMPLAEYLAVIEKNEPTNLRIFLFNLFKYKPSLKSEFPCPQIMKGFMGRFGFMFFGGKDTTVRIHYDIDMCHVLHTHFGGRKRVVLFAPQYSRQLYCLPLNTYSLVNIDRPDYEKYPALALVRGSEIILEDGDSLFMPAGYWHYMTYLEGSFSVSYRKLSHHPATVLHGLLNLAVYMPMDKLFNQLFGAGWLRTKQRIAANRGWRVLGVPRNEEPNEMLGI